MMPKKSQTSRPEKEQQAASRAVMPPKKVYNREFKLETLRLLRSNNKTKADLERELGLYPGQVHPWERAFNKERGQCGAGLCKMLTSSIRVAIRPSKCQALQALEVVVLRFIPFSHLRAMAQVSHVSQYGT
jgi:transposase-like protein